MDGDEFLRKFEEELNFQSQSPDVQMVSVEFFLSRILPQVEVITIISPFQVSDHKFSGLLVLYTIPKDFNETWSPFWRLEGDVGSTPRVPYFVIFYGIGVPSEKYDGPPVENHREGLYYQSVYGGYLKEVGKIPEEKVIQAIREAQKEEDLRIWCQNISAEEIGSVMSREFSEGWLSVLEVSVDSILGRKKSIVPMLRGEDNPPNSFTYQEFVETEKNGIDYYYNHFYSDYKWFGLPSPSTEFSSGGRNACRIQRQRLEQVQQGEFLLEDFLKITLQDIKTLVQIRDKTTAYRLFFPKILVQEQLEREPQLMTLVFNNLDQLPPTEYLRQFEKKLKIQPLPGEGKKVSTDLLINHILPQVIILRWAEYHPIAEDKTHYLLLVVIGKEEYEELLTGKLLDVIVFRGIIFDGHTEQLGKLNSFNYYPSPLSEHICHMASCDFKLGEAKEVRKKIQWYQQWVLDAPDEKKKRYQKQFADDKKPEENTEYYLEEKEFSKQIRSSLEQFLDQKKNEYYIEITHEGKNLGHLRIIQHLEDPQFINFIHLWLEKNQKRIYVGHYRRDTGDLKFEAKPKVLIRQHRFLKETQFQIRKNGEI